MYAVTREPMTDADRKVVARSGAPSHQTVWLPLGVASSGLMIMVVCAAYTPTAAGPYIQLPVTIGIYAFGMAVLVCAWWNLRAWFADRSQRARNRKRYEILCKNIEVEVVHFRAEAAWRIPPDAFGDLDDKLGVLYRIDSDAFVTTPLYEFSLPGSGARVPAEVSMRRTPAPTLAQLTEFVAIGTETLPLLEQLERSASMDWALEMSEKYEAGGVLRRNELPEDWRAVV